MTEVTRSLPVLFLACLTLAGCISGVPAGNPSPASQRFLSLDEAAPLTFVAMGDSTVEGVGATSPARNYVSRLHERLRTRVPRAQMVNLGVGGATAAGVRYRQLLWALERRPDLVRLSVGPSDITTQRSLGDYSRDIEVILGILTERTTARSSWST